MIMLAAHRRRLVATALALIIPQISGAQTANAGSTCSVFDPETLISTENQGQPTCSTSGSSASASASATNGVLKTTAFASVSANSLASARSSGYASWTDYLTVTSGSATYARFDFAVRGTMGRSASGSDERGFWVSAPGATFSVFNSFENRIDRSYEALPPNAPVDAYLYPYSGSVFDRFSLTVQLGTGGGAYISYSMQAQQYTYTTYRYAGLTGPVESPAMQGFSDFGSTGGMTGVTFFDAELNALSNVQYAFNNGATFYDTNAGDVTVPEPDSAALASIGLLLLAVLRRRQLKAASRFV